MKIKQKHITYVSMLLNTAIMGKQLSARVNQVQYTVVKGIILFWPSPLKGALCIKYIKFSNSRVISRAFGLQNSKIINESCQANLTRVN